MYYEKSKMITFDFSASMYLHNITHRLLIGLFVCQDHYETHQIYLYNLIMYIFGNRYGRPLSLLNTSKLQCAVAK